MSQELEETRGGTAPPPAPRGGLDPWAALSSSDDDDVVVAPAAPAPVVAAPPTKKPSLPSQPTNNAQHLPGAHDAEDEYDIRVDDHGRGHSVGGDEPDADERDFNGAVPGPDRASGLAADANAAAVEAWIAERAAERAAEPAPSRGGAFTIPLVCAGIAVIAACLLIPQADANRRLAYERLKLQADLQAVERQVEVNDEFLRKVSHDPNLAERLAQRQMKIIREGNHVLNLKSDGEDEMSPFQLTAVPAPADLPPYQPRGGLLAGLCQNPKSRLYLMGAGLLAIAAGLVLGFGGRADE